jgi:hypothetical protein
LVSMGWDYVSDLLSLTDILFIPQMIWVGERRWNVTDRRKQKNSGEKPVPVPLTVHHNSHMDWAGPSRREAGDWQPESWHGLFMTSLQNVVRHVKQCCSSSYLFL